VTNRIPSSHPIDFLIKKTATFLALFLRIISLEPSEKLNVLMNANWKLPKTQKSLHNLLHNPKEGDFWQADHIKAVAEGGGNAGLDNLRTLCTPCHQVETERLRGRLKLIDKSQRNEVQVKESPGTDIRMLFAKQQQQSTTKPKKKRSAD
jgi:hypothetical protein